MSKKNKPILIVNAVKENINGVYITSAHNTSGIALHHLKPELIWNENKKAYVKEFEKEFKLKYKL
jgi:hypothetical protein